MRHQLKAERNNLTMQSLVVFITILAVSGAFPLILQEHYLDVPVAKSTITHSSQIVEHGNTYHALPVVHAVETAKKTITSSRQVVNHGGSTVLHTPVHYEVYGVPVVNHLQQYETLVHTPAVHTPVVYHHTPVVL